MYGETTGRFLHFLKAIYQINYWGKLEKLPDSELLKRCLKIQKDFLVQGQYSWFGKVGDILNICGITLNQNSLENVDIICKMAKVNLYTKQQESIIAEINNTKQQPKLRTYKLF